MLLLLLLPIQRRALIRRREAAAAFLSGFNEDIISAVPAAEIMEATCQITTATRHIDPRRGGDSPQPQPPQPRQVLCRDLMD